MQYVKGPRWIPVFIFIVASSGAVISIQFFSASVVLHGSYIILASFITILIYKINYACKVYISGDKLWKLNIILILFSISISVISRVLGIIVAGLAFGTVAFQLITDKDPKWPLVQITGAFLIQPVAKLLTNELYFGTGDLLRDTGRANGIIQIGSISGIPDLYEFFPGSHILFAISSLVFDLPTYRIGLIVVATLYATTIPVIYLISRQYVPDHQAYMSSLFVAIIPEIQLAASEFHSQQMGAGLFLVLLYLLIISDSSRKQLTAFIIALSIVATHHITFILSLPIVFIMAIFGEYNFDSRTVIVTYVSVFAYWVYVAGIVLVYIISTASTQISIGISRFFNLDISAESMLWLGKRDAPSIVSTIFSPNQISQIVLLIFGIMALGVIINQWQKNQIKNWDVLTLAVIGSVAIYHTPFTHRLVPRVILFTSLFFAVALSYGFANFSTRPIIFSALIAIGAVSGGLVAADDIGLSESAPNSYSDSEVKQLELVGDYSRSRSITSTWAVRTAISVLSDSDIYSLNVTETSLAGDGLFAIWDEWGDHWMIAERGAGTNTPVGISKECMKIVEQEHNKVWTGGDFFVISNNFNISQNCQMESK